MFLFHFILKSRKIDIILRENSNITLVKRDGDNFTVIGNNKKDINKIKHEIWLLQPNNIYENLRDDSIYIFPVKINFNNENFQLAYEDAKNIFKKELLTTLDNDIINFYNNNIIELSKTINTPMKFDKFLQKKIPLKFRKDIFLQTYDFIIEINKELEPAKLKISFEQIYKYIWKKTISPLES